MKKLCAVLAMLVLTLVTNADTFNDKSENKKFIRNDCPIDNSYIVVLNDDENKLVETNIDEISEELAAQVGGKTKKLFYSSIKGFVAEMTDDEAETLSRDPRVKFVEQDGLASVSTSQPSVTWGLDRIDQRQLPLNQNYTYNATGSGVNAYIIDTGIRPTHAEFAGRAAVAFDALTDNQNGIDCNGHGTHVAGILGGKTYGVAKNVSLYAVRVMNCTGFGQVSDIISGIDWVTANRNPQMPAVANMSLNISGTSNALDTAVNRSVASGITYVVSSGNNNRDACNYSPGHLSGVITVGATDSNDNRWGNSNFGSCVDIFAPGGSVLSSYYRNDTEVVYMSGTSMAAPHAAGAAALYLEANRQAMPGDVQQHLLNESTTGMIATLDAASPNKILFALVGTASEPTPAAVTIVNEVTTLDGRHASTVSFPFSAVNFGQGNFSLVDNNVVGADRVVNTNITAIGEQNVITVESVPVAGWNLSSITCVENKLQNTVTSMVSRKASIIVDDGESVTCTFKSAQVAPSAASASVSGRVLTATGIPVRRAAVSMHNANTLETLTTYTNALGYYRFDNLAVNDFYILSVSHGKKMFSNDTRSFTLSEDLTEYNFTAAY